MSELRISEVRGRRDRRRFVRFPWQVYRGAQPDPNWVPPLLFERDAFFNPQRNPFFQHSEVALFLAWRGSTVVGTIAAVIDHTHNATHQERSGTWGCFEVLDDPEAARSLLATAVRWVSARGASVIRGPFNLSINDECGLLIRGFDAPPIAMMTYNPQRYIEYVSAAAMQPVMDLHAWEISAQLPMPARLERIAALAERRPGLVARTLDLRHFKAEVQRGWEFYNLTWSANWGAVPMSEAEFHRLAESLRFFFDPRITSIVEINGELVGLLIAIPDLNLPLRQLNGRLLPLGWWTLLRQRRSLPGMRVLIMGVHPRYRRRGIDALMYRNVWRSAIAAGYQQAELSWILDSNTVMNNTLAALGARNTKTYRLYEQALLDLSKLPDSGIVYGI